MTASDSGRRRFLIGRLAVATLLALAAVGVTACKPTVEAPPKSGFCGSTPTKKTGVSSPVAAPSSGGLRVVETGFTMIGLDANHPDGVTVGVVVENTSSLVAYRTQVVIRALDPTGASAVNPSFSLALHQEIPVILPGQRVGIGANSVGLQEPDFGQYDKVSTVDVKLTGEQWWPRDNDVHQFAEVTGTAHDLDLNTKNTFGTLQATVDSGYCRPVPPRGIGVVLRNSNGSIIGGGFDTQRDYCMPGVTNWYVSFDHSVPPSVDPAKTTVYPMCDPSPREAYPTGSDNPLN